MSKKELTKKVSPHLYKRKFGKLTIQYILCTIHRKNYIVLDVFMILVLIKYNFIYFKGSTKLIASPMWSYSPCGD